MDRLPIVTNPFFDHPILNSPYMRPARHWELDGNGQPTQKILERRRAVSFITPIPKPTPAEAAAAATGAALALAARATALLLSIGMAAAHPPSIGTQQARSNFFIVTRKWAGSI